MKFEYKVERGVIVERSFTAEYLSKTLSFFVIIILNFCEFSFQLIAKDYVHSLMDLLLDLVY